MSWTSIFNEATGIGRGEIAVFVGLLCLVVYSTMIFAGRK